MYAPRLPALAEPLASDVISWTTLPALALALARLLPLLRRTAGAARRPARGPAEALAALHALLCALFTAEELLRVLRHSDDTAPLVPDLPGVGTPLATLVDAVVQGLARRGLITAHFFARLQAERPGRADDIASCQALFRFG